MIRTAAAAGAVLWVLSTSGALAQELPACPGGRSPAGDIGIRAIRCIGPSAACAIFVQDAEGGLRHRFSVEPILTGIEAPGSAAGLETGDVLVAIDGRLVTTWEGGRHLANLPVGQPIAVMLRREGRISEFRVTTSPGCGIRSLSVVQQGGP